PAHIERTPYEQAVVAAAPVPQRHWRHLQDRIVGEKPYQRGDIGRLESAQVPLDCRAYPRVVRLAYFAHVTHVRDGSAGPLQSAVDSRDRGPKLGGNLSGTELEYLPEQEHGPLPRRQHLHRGHQLETHIRSHSDVEPRVGCLALRREWHAPDHFGPAALG